MRAAVVVVVLLSTLPIVPSQAEEPAFPERRPGMWEVRMTTDQPGAPDLTMQICLDAETDAEMMQAGLSMSRDMCSKQEMSREGDSLVIDATCEVSGMKITSHSVMSGDFQSAYTIEITSDIEGAPSGMPAKSTMTQAATWIGEECTGGLEPGDMLMPGGVKMNTRNMMKGLGPGG